MKKAVIGLSVLAVFIMYSLWVRHEQPTLAKPSSLADAGNVTNSQSQSDAAPSSSSGSGSTMSGGAPIGSGTATQYKDGTYTGSTEDAYYGNVQVAATVSAGKLIDVRFLQYPDTHDTSVMINQQAMPYLKQEAIQAQNANVQIVSGATFTSQAFIQSLTAALAAAKA